MWLGLIALRPLEIYDAGLYHLQAILWNGSYPTVPGLGNLHGRLAFYTSYFLLQAAFDQGPLAGQSYRAVAGLLAVVFLTQVAVSVVRVLPIALTRHAPQSASAADWLLALMALPTLLTIGNEGLSTTSSDLPLFPLQVLAAHYLLSWQDPALANQRARYLSQALMLASLGATIKLK